MNSWAETEVFHPSPNCSSCGRTIPNAEITMRSVQECYASFGPELPLFPVDHTSRSFPACEALEIPWTSPNLEFIQQYIFTNCSMSLKGDKSKSGLAALKADLQKKFVICHGIQRRHLLWRKRFGGILLSSLPKHLGLDGRKAGANTYTTDLESHPMSVESWIRHFAEHFHTSTVSPNVARGLFASGRN